MDEEMAFRLVELYLREVPHRGEKRRMTLDTIINAYLYTLSRLKRKKKELGLIEEIVEREEKEIPSEVSELLKEEKKEKRFDFE